MHPALRKGPLFLQNAPPISFPAYGPSAKHPQCPQHSVAKR